MWPSFFSFKIHPERMGIRNYLWRRVSISIVIYARFSIAIISRKYFVIFCQVVNSTLTKLAMMNAKPRQTINLYLDLIKKSAIKFRFVCLGFYIPLEKCSLIWRSHHYRRRASNFYICSALMAIKQWGFLACQHYCVTGHPFIMVISKDPRHTPVLVA